MNNTVEVVIVDRATGYEVGKQLITRARLAYLTHMGLVVVAGSLIKVYI